MPISPNSLTITATLSIAGLRISFESKVVLPLPRKPVRMETGTRSWGVVWGLLIASPPLRVARI